MIIHKSNIERPEGFKIESLELDKVHISIKGKEGENIWVRKDPENDVMYLSNHAVMFYPMPSWGMELPLRDDIDLYPFRGDSPDDTVITVAPEAYDELKVFIKENDELDIDAYMEQFQKEFDSCDGCCTENCEACGNNKEKPDYIVDQYDPEDEFIKDLPTA